MHNMYYQLRQTKEGDTFDTLKKCITINIVDYEFLPMKKMHTRYHITEDETGYRLTDVLEVHFCELKKLNHWCYPPLVESIILLSLTDITVTSLIHFLLKKRPRHRKHFNI